MTTRWTWFAACLLALTGCSTSGSAPDVNADQGHEQFEDERIQLQLDQQREEQRQWEEAEREREVQEREAAELSQRIGYLEEQVRLDEIDHQRDLTHYSEDGWISEADEAAMAFSNYIAAGNRNELHLVRLYGDSVPTNNYGRPGESGRCPPSLPVKGNFAESGEQIFHLPGWEYYDLTLPEECLANGSSARRRGFRPSLVR